MLSDASGSRGGGAYSDKEWFQFQWPAGLPECHITVKEMVPVVVAATLWGASWQARSVRFHSTTLR